MRTTTYRITFDKIGRNHNVGPIAVASAEDDAVADRIARQVFDVARGHLLSTDVNVTVELGEAPGTGGQGYISAGFQTVGTFTVTPTLTTDDESDATG